MKRILFLISVTLLLSRVAFAQTFEESMRYWSDGPLTWDDLTLRSSRLYTSDLNFRWMYQTEKRRVAWNTVEKISTPVVALDKSISWHNLDRTYPEALRYDQLIFDLNELYYRKLLTEFNNPNNNQSYSQLHNFYHDQLQARWREILEETDQGMDTTMLRVYENEVSADLDNTSYPTSADRKKFWGISYFAGASFYSFMDEAAITFRPAWGFNFGTEFYYRHHVVTLMMASGSGRLAQDYLYGLKTWPKGDRFEHFQVTADYGYTICDGTTFGITPYLGFGLESIEWRDRSVPDSKSEELAGLIARAGLEINFKFRRRIDDEGVIENSLVLRPYIAYCPGDIPGKWLFGAHLNYRLSAHVMK